MLFRGIMCVSLLWSTSRAIVPDARYGHTMTVLANGTAVLFGGFADSVYLNDVYKLEVSGTTATWTELLCAGATPLARRHHTITVLPDGTAVLFGGEGNSGSFSHSWRCQAPRQLGR